MYCGRPHMHAMRHFTRGVDLQLQEACGSNTDGSAAGGGAADATPPGLAPLCSPCPDEFPSAERSVSMTSSNHVIRGSHDAPIRAGIGATSSPTPQDVRVPITDKVRLGIASSALPIWHAACSVLSVKTVYVSRDAMMWHCL